MSNVDRLIELGISAEEARQCLNSTNNDLQKAVDLFFSSSPHQTWSKFQWNHTTNEQDMPLLEGISASLRELRGVKDHPVKEPLEVIAFNLDTVDDISTDNSPITLIGLKSTSQLTSILIASSEWGPVRNAILRTANDSMNWGSPDDSFYCHDVVKMESLVKEVQRVFAARLLSKRQTRSCVRATLAFVAYREYLNLGIPATTEETWAYFLHALTAEIKIIPQLTHVQLIRKDEVGNRSENLLVGVNVSEEMSLHECLTKITLTNQSYLYSSVKDLNQGRLLCFLCSQATAVQPFPQHLYIDRYLEQNAAQVEPLIEQKELLRARMAKLLLELSQLDDRNLNAIKETIAFMESDLKVTSMIREMETKVEYKIKGIKSEIQFLKELVTKIFDIPALQKYAFTLQSVFVQEDLSHTVYVNQGNAGWWFYRGPETRRSSYEEATDIRQKITCLWYVFGQECEELDEIPASLKALFIK